MTQETFEQTFLRVLNTQGHEPTPFYGYTILPEEMDCFAHALRSELAKQAGSVEPVEHQFQDRNGTWEPFIDKTHYENTFMDSSWPIRALWDASALAAQAAKIAELQDEIAKLKPDAERYQAIKKWGGAIRDSEAAPNIRLYGLQGIAEEVFLSADPENLDAAIDAARNAK